MKPSSTGTLTSEAVLGPGTVIVLGVGMTEQLGEDEPGMGRSFTDPAVCDRFGLSRYLSLAIQLTELVC